MGRLILGPTIMANKKIIIHYNDQKVTVTLKSAKKLDGIRRATLMTDAIKMDQNDPLALTAFYLYPTCVCSVEEPAWLKDISLQDFAEKVDEVDIDTWIAGAYEINPHWKAGMQALAKMGEEDEKKPGTPSTG